MTPSSSTAVRRVASSRAVPDPGHSSSRRPPLRIVPARRRDRARGRLIKYLPVLMVVGALLVVVVGQAFLANGQVRMSGLDQQLQTAQGQHRQNELSVSKLETPSRIVGYASGQLQMVHPSHVTQLPYVSLTTPLPTPVVTPAPATSATRAGTQ
jgi:hypothetical protein